MSGQQWTRWLRNPISAVIVFAASVGMSITYDTYAGQKVRHPRTSDVQQKLDALARSHATEDELEKLLIKPERTRLDTSSSSLLAISRLRVSSDGDLIVLDVFGRNVVRFDAEGKLLGAVGAGRAGTGPGEFLFPSGVDVGRTDTLVSDFKQTRISRLTPQGVFQNSFSTGVQRFSAKSIFTSHDGADIYVCGDRYSAGLTEVHRYSAGGVFEGSLFPLPDWARQLNLEAFSDCLPATSSSRTLLAFPYEYKVYEITGGEARPLDIDAPGDFRKPARPLVFAGVDPSQHLTVFEQWKAEWTPLENIALLNDTHLLVEYRTYNPLRYTLDIWNLSDGKRVNTIHTNYRLLTADSRNRSYFLAEHSKEHDPYELLSGSFSR